MSHMRKLRQFYELSPWLLLLLCFITECVISDPISARTDLNLSIAPLAIAAIAAGASALANGIGGAFGNRKRKKAREEYESEARQANEEYNQALEQEIESNYLDRADSQAAVRRVVEHNNEVAKRQQSNAIKGGLTDEAKVALAGEQSKAVADTVSQIAGQGAQYKAGLRNQLAQAKHHQRLQLANLKYGSDSDTTYLDNMLNAIGQSANMIGTTAMFGGGSSGGVSAPQVQKVSAPQVSSTVKPLGFDPNVIKKPKLL